jgi:hypothetical protein
MSIEDRFHEASIEGIEREQEENMMEAERVQSLSEDKYHDDLRVFTNKMVIDLAVYNLTAEFGFEMRMKDIAQYIEDNY